MTSMKKASKLTVIVNEEVGDEEQRAIDTTKDLILNTVGVVGPGLLVVTVPPGLVLTQVQMAIERQIRSGSRRTGLHFPKKRTMKSLYAGNGRRVLQAKALALALPPIDGAPAHEFEAIGTRDGFTVTCDEGLCAVIPFIEKAKGGWVTFAQSVDGFPTSSIAETLMRLRQAAKQAGTYVLFIMVTDGKREDLRIYDYCDDLLITAPCDPEPDVQFAFSVDVHGLRDLNQMGIGKTMCTVRVLNDQHKWKWEGFVAADLIKRVTWLLRCSGKSLDEIGKIFHSDKSTVHRRMAGLPPLVKREFKEGWLKPYADLLEIAIDSDEDTESDEEV